MIAAIGSKKRPTLKRSLLDHGLSPEECWPWLGFVDENGYGRGYRNGNRSAPTGAHRIVYELLNGPLSKDLHVDHRCHDFRVCQLGARCPHRRCVNPHHLEAVTPKVNNDRSGSPISDNGRKTHCKQGHPFSDENTAPHGTGYGRKCLTCEITRSRERRAALGARPRYARRTFTPVPVDEERDSNGSDRSS